MSDMVWDRLGLLVGLAVAALATVCSVVFIARIGELLR
jgi:hypothetical protein